MIYKSLIMMAVAALTLSGYSIWSGVESINGDKILSRLEKDGMYTPGGPTRPVSLSSSDPRAKVPAYLKDQLNTFNPEEKGDS